MSCLGRWHLYPSVLRPLCEPQWLLQVLASLSGRAHAMKKHLAVHTVQLRKSVNQLLKPQNAGWAFTVSRASARWDWLF